jgi:predicted HAD superfamily phosphohydrolase YqeG
MAIIVDIDDTIVRNGSQPIQKNIDWINALGERKIIITGRPDGARADTVAMLKRIGFTYSRLMMNPYGSDKSGDWKREAASKLTDIVLAIDNDPKVRRIYNSLGIKTKDPATI